MILRQIELTYWLGKILWWCVTYSLHLTVLAALIALLAYLLTPTRGKVERD